MRVPTRRYSDPLDQIWLTCAARIGFRIARSADVYASSDGRGTITLGTDETLDPDDCLAQMILHELCHALVEGPSAHGKPDWGLDQTSDRDVPREQACLRLQAALLAPHGLREALAPTTDHRNYYDGLPADVLPAGGDDPVLVTARLAWHRAHRAPFAPHLDEALAATATVARAAAAFAPTPVDDAAAQGDVAEPLVSLWRVIDDPGPWHATGLPLRATPGATCAGCAWAYEHRGALRCRQANGAKVALAAPACARYEDAVDCQTCGACCRAAYHSVEVQPRDAFVKRHPELIVKHAAYLEIRREGDRCAALGGGHAPGEPYACAVYEDRPRTCREFTRLSGHCLDARRRVGLSL